MLLVAYIILIAVDYKTHMTVYLLFVFVFIVFFPFLFTIYAVLICCILCRSENNATRNALLNVRAHISCSNEF